MEFNEISYLVCSYLVVCDDEIHINELTILKKLYKNISEDCRKESQKIFSDDESKISLDSLMQKVAVVGQQEKLFLLDCLYKISYSDNFLHSKEKQFIGEVNKILGIQKKEDDLCRKDNESFFSKITIYKEEEVCWQDQLKQSFYNFLFELHEKEEKYQGELLQGKSFVRKIRSIGQRAKSDLFIAEKNMGDLNDDIKLFMFKINQKTYSFREKDKSKENVLNFLEFLENLKKIIETKVQLLLKENLLMLEKKRKTVDFFTIAFMGRTKSGKSTFHKVITKDDSNDIGIGKLRTTRFNRVFNWENIRIIDTPGIGAPGGKMDTEIARGIVDEADLVCYLVTNDAIQETEFNFLSELKDKNKPIFIILNYKENLTNSSRLKRFFKNPLEWKERRDDKSIQGHIQRIREMICKSNYDTNFIEIIPIQLLAAKIAIESKERNENHKLLHEGSNIDEYTTKIKKVIFKSGNLKKTQNILEGCNFYVSNVVSEIDSILKMGKDRQQSLCDKKKKILEYVLKEKKILITTVLQCIDAEFANLESSVTLFAEKNYESKNFEEQWNNHINREKYFVRLKEVVENELVSSLKRINEKIGESFEDFALEMDEGFNNVGFQSNDISSYKTISTFTFGGVMLAISILGLTNIWNPGGWVLLGITFVGSIITSLFESKVNKIKKAKDKIRKVLIPEIKKNKIEIKEQLSGKFEDHINKIYEEIRKEFDFLISELDNINERLEILRRNANDKFELFNQIFSFRVLEHLEEVPFDNDYTESQIIKLMSEYKVIRNFNCSSFYIYGDFNVSHDKKIEINKLLQLDFNFQSQK